MDEISLHFNFEVPTEILAVLSIVQPKDALDIYLQVQSSQNRQLKELVEKTRKSLLPFIQFQPKFIDPSPLNYDVIVQVLNNLVKGGRIQEKVNLQGETEYLLAR